jgi:uncharacterized protein
MSQNVEMVRRAIDSVNRGYFRPTKETADDFEMDWSNSIGPLSGVYRGPEQVNDVLKSFREAWDDWQWEPQEMVDLDGDQVLVVNRIRMRGRASRVEVQATGVQVWTIRNGKLAGVKLYQSKAEAFKAGAIGRRTTRRDTARAMSQENIEVIRKAAEVFNAEGPEAAARRFFAEDVEFHDPPESPSPRVARGREEVGKQFNSFNEAWEKHRTDPKEIRAVGTDKVLLFSVEHFTGRDGIEVEAPAAALFTLRDGKIIRWEAFWDQQRALEAVGLSE